MTEWTESAERDAVAWLRERAIPLASRRIGDGFDDLEALAPAMGGATVVGLGESTHGSGSEFELKARLFEWLATSSDVRCLAIERDVADADVVDRFVRGRAEELTLGFAMTPWRTAELEACVRWMRSCDLDLSFAGFDSQAEVGPGSAEIVRAHLAGSGAGSADLDALLEPVLDVLSPGSAYDAAAHERALASLDILAARVEKAGGPEAAWAHHNVEALRQGCAVRAARENGAGAEAMRDGFMADNIAWLADQTPGSGVAVWAHNGHVLRKEDAMGGALASRFGDRYRPVGFAFHAGTYSTYLQKASGGVTDFVEVAATPSRPGCIEWLLHQVGLPMFAVDMRAAKAQEPAPPLLLQPMATRVVGVGGSETPSWEEEFGEYSIVVPDAFDVMIYIEESTPSQVLASLFDGVPEGV